MLQQKAQEVQVKDRPLSIKLYLVYMTKRGCVVTDHREERLFYTTLHLGHIESAAYV